MARCSSAASTEESTPPDSPSSTLSEPTCARMRATLSSMMLPVAQLAAQPAISRTKRRRISPPCRVWVTSGWNCTA